MLYSELLIKAKDYLSKGDSKEDSGKTNFICHAIESAAIACTPHGVSCFSTLEYQRANDLRKMIEDRLDNCYTISTWLCDQGISKRAQTPKRLQQYRHQWLDMLIEEYKAKGM